MKCLLVAASSLVLLACGGRGMTAIGDPAAETGDARVEDQELGSATAHAAYAEQRLDAVLARSSSNPFAAFLARLAATLAIGRHGAARLFDSGVPTKPRNLSSHTLPTL